MGTCVGDTHTHTSGHDSFSGRPERTARHRWVCFTRDLWEGLIGLIYPKTCIVCTARLDGTAIGGVVCGECWKKIKKNRPPFCHRCGRQLKAPFYTKNICPVCVRKTLYFDRVFSPCAYEGPIKELLRQFKYGSKEYVGTLLGSLMVDFIREYDLPMEIIDAVVPVPLHRAKVREREFNQSLILGRCIAQTFDKHLLDGCLIRHRHTKTQTALTPSERLLNVQGSFSVVHTQSVQGKNILLIDDVLTTGATASQASLALKNAGATIVFVMALAN